MATAAQIAACGRNAKKSKGPTSVVGKACSRLNSFKHGMTARFVLLSDENPTAFKDRMAGWIAALKPRNGIELFLAERAVYFSWQLDRVHRAHWARLRLKALTAAEDEEFRVEQEVAELTHRLFRKSRGPVAEHQRGRAGDFRPEGFDESDQPTLLVARLESTGAGCCWLLERWIDLGAILAKKLPWLASDRFKAIRMLRMHAIESIGAPKLTALMQACQVLDPQAGDLVNEMWQDLRPAEAARLREQFHAGRAEQSRPPDKDAARQQLLEIVNREIERLETKVERHEERAELEASLSEQRLAFDESPDGELLRNYEVSCNEFLFQVLDTLQYRRHSEKVKPCAPVYTDNDSFLSACFKPPAAVIDSRGTNKRSRRTDIRASVDQGGTMSAIEPSPLPGRGPTARNESPPREKLTAAGGPAAQSAGSPRVTQEQQGKLMTATEQILQIEAISAMLAGRHVNASPVREHRATKRAKITTKAIAQIKPVDRRATSPSLNGLGPSAQW